MLAGMTFFFSHCIAGSLRDLKCHHTVGASSYTNRTHLCGELRLKDVGQKITLCGWLQFFRLRQFLILRDWHGTTQLVIPEHKVGHEK